MSNGSMCVRLEKNEHTQKITLSGEIDFAASLDIDPWLSKAVNDCDDEIVLDMGKVTYIDSEGIKMLLHIFRQVEEKNKRARIIECSPKILRVFKLAGVEALLNIAPTPPGPHIIKTPQQRIQPFQWQK